MFILNKIKEITSSVSNQEIDAYLSNILSYKTLNEILDGNKLSSSFRIELFYVMNEDISMNDIGSVPYSSYLDDLNIQLYEKVPPAALFGIDYIEGLLSPKTKKIYKLYNIQTSVGLAKKVSYSSIENLNSEIERILYSVSPKETTIHLKEVGSEFQLYDGDTLLENVVSLKYDLDGNLYSYTTLVDETKTEVVVNYTDSAFVKFIKEFSECKYAFEYTNVNGRVSNMLTTNHIAIYSALLNFTKEQLDSTKVYLKKYLKGICPDTNTNYTNLYDNWNNFGVLFERFLKEISKRTIHY